jgi:hypothetical protein
MTDWSLLHDLAHPFPDSLIRQPAPGKHGEYIKHSDVTQRMLSIVGFHDFEIVELIRGYAAEVVGRGKTPKTWPARDGAVVGCIATMRITDSEGRTHTVTEIGTEDQPAMQSDSENAKNAASDAYKRCAMRFGLGLHMWSPDSYFLETLLARRVGDDEPGESSDLAEMAEAASDTDSASDEPAA